MHEPVRKDIRPLIGVSACHRDIGGRWFHAVLDQYARAVVDGAGCQPVLIPALSDANDIDLLLDRLDGLMLTGSPSNVEPHHYGGPQSRDGVMHDPPRDASTLPLIRRSVDAGFPLFGICRGFQEINVAYGGTLHQHLHELPGRFDHRQDESVPYDQRYGLRHEIDVTPGGLLAQLVGKQQTRVNTLHEQGVDRLGDGLTVEAVAPDTTVEALSIDNAPGFALAVQWHPEFQVLQNPDSLALFRAFGNAAREQARDKGRIAASF